MPLTTKELINRSSLLLLFDTVRVDDLIRKSDVEKRERKRVKKRMREEGEKREKESVIGHKSNVVFFLFFLHFFYDTSS